MALLALRCLTAWTEDRATQRCDPSAAPGAETEGRADAVRSAARTYQPLRDRHESDKPSRQDAATRPAGCDSRFANARRPKFQFTLNQYTRRSSLRSSSAKTIGPSAIRLARSDE
jgi:hypothetical protein